MFQTNKHTVIKPVYKGGVEVVLSREEKVKEVNKKLNNTVIRNSKPPCVGTHFPLVEEILLSLEIEKFMNGNKNVISKNLLSLELVF